MFQRWCVPCHGTQPNAPGTLRLRWNRGEAFALLEQHRDFDPAYIADSVRRGRGEKPAFGPTEIADAELAAVIGYLTKRP